MGHRPGRRPFCSRVRGSPSRSKTMLASWVRWAIIAFFALRPRSSNSLTCNGPGYLERLDQREEPGKSLHPTFRPFKISSIQVGIGSMVRKG